MLNKIKVSGVVMTEPVLEENFGSEGIYGFTLGIKKLGKDEYHSVTVRVSDRFDCFRDIRTGVCVDISGSFRSVNKKSDTLGYKRLVVSIFCSSISIVSDFKESVNEGEIVGVIVNTPYFAQKTEKMPQRCDTMLKIDRAYGKYTYIPVTFRGRNAEYASHKKVGDIVNCTGRLQSREYRKEIGGKLQQLSTVEFVATGIEDVSETSSEE